MVDPAFGVLVSFSGNRRFVSSFLLFEAAFLFFSVYLLSRSSACPCLAFCTAFPIVRMQRGLFMGKEAGLRYGQMHCVQLSWSSFPSFFTSCIFILVASFLLLVYILGGMVSRMTSHGFSSPYLPVFISLPSLFACVAPGAEGIVRTARREDPGTTLVIVFHRWMDGRRYAVSLIVHKSLGRWRGEREGCRGPLGFMNMCICITSA